MAGPTATRSSPRARIHHHRRSRTPHHMPLNPRTNTRPDRSPRSMVTIEPALLRKNPLLFGDERY